MSAKVCHADAERSTRHEPQADAARGKEHTECSATVEPLLDGQHPSNTLVLGPFPLVDRSIRLPLGVVLVGMLALLLAAVAALVVADEPVVRPIRSLALRALGGQPVPPPAAAGAPEPAPERAARCRHPADGQVVAQTPADVAAGSHTVMLRRAGAPDVGVLDPSAAVAVPVWSRPACFGTTTGARQRDYRPHAGRLDGLAPSAAATCGLGPRPVLRGP
jgi:hypothetical protein